MDFVDFKTLKRPRSPNTHLVAPRGLCEQTKPDRVSKFLAIDPDALYGAVLDLVNERSDWELESTDEERRLIHFIAVTRLMRYKDDIDILILPTEAEDAGNLPGAHLAIYSRSRIGHSDMGANRKRVSKLLASLENVQVET